MPLSKKLRSTPHKSRKKEIGKSKLPSQIIRGVSPPEDVFRSLQFLSIYHNQYTYPELIFQDNVVFYKDLIEYGNYHLTKDPIHTYAYPRNIYLCIFLNRPAIFKLLYNSYYKDKFIEGSTNFSGFNTLEGILVECFGKTEKKEFDFNETFVELMNIKRPDEARIFRHRSSNVQDQLKFLFWHVVIVLGRIDILSIVQDDIHDKKEFHKSIIKDFKGVVGEPERIFVPNGVEGVQMVELLKRDFFFKDQEITRFDLPENLLASSINKKLKASKDILTPVKVPDFPLDSFLGIGKELSKAE